MQKAAIPPVRQPSLDDTLARCQALGLRLSRQRRYILQLLWTTQEHLSAREIYNRLNQQGYEIGHTSVYQNLDTLASHGIIECVERSDGRLYGSLSTTHSHVNCLDTEQILDIFVKLPDDIVAAIEQQTGIQIVDYRIDFFGYQTPPEAAAEAASLDQVQAQSQGKAQNAVTSP
ncbi:MAG: Fur family transcriptional regulator [Cyanobacteria bacterium P01_H01_bin.121]